MCIYNRSPLSVIGFIFQQPKSKIYIPICESLEQKIYSSVPIDRLTKVLITIFERTTVSAVHYYDFHANPHLRDMSNRKAARVSFIIRGIELL